jgi:hypothetical protein
MPHKPIKIDPNRHFCGKPIGVYVPKPKPAEAKQKELDRKKPEPKPIHEESWIRGPKLEVFIPKEPGATMEEALAKAEKEKRVIASSKRLDQALVGSDEWESIQAALWCWTGTMTAYEKPGKKFGKTVEYVDDKTKIRYVFEVPGQYVGEKDAILVAEHPDYKLEIDGNNRIIRAAVIDLIERFPAESNKWYLTDSKRGIPFGNVVDDSDSNARYLWRIEKRVGFSARGCYNFGNYVRNVNLNIAPSVSVGVAVEGPKGPRRKK